MSPSIWMTKLFARRVHLLAAGVLFGAVSLSGCTSVKAIVSFLTPKTVPGVEIEEIRVFSDPKANLNSPVEFEIVFVRDPDVLTKIAALPAAKWFELREDIRKTYPEMVESQKWELVPGQDLTVPSADLENKRAFGVMIFANYLTPGEHRARIDTFPKGVIIRLGPKGFTVAARGAAGK